ncbi:MAG: ABC transporter permease, partial [Actinomycetota bacterium]|nr:ABC transporter permease [Actinomycetota bacterium]
MAFAIGISVTLLLIGASIGRAGDARAARFDGTVPTTVADVVQRAGGESDQVLAQTRASATFEVHVSVLNSAGHQVQGADIAPLVSKPPLPPGVSTFPGPGGLVVSPALADLLRSGAGAGLRPRL